MIDAKPISRFLTKKNNTYQNAQIQLVCSMLKAFGNSGFLLSACTYFIWFTELFINFEPIIECKR